MFSIKFSVRKSTVIPEDVHIVYKRVADFSTWRIWSPWLCQEPECPVDITGDPGASGHAQAWDGKRIGAGQITLKAAHPGRALAYDLSFIRPWKSRATADFHFEAREGGTRVTWSMQGSLPLFLFFMKKMMAAGIGCDYERGLAMLKEYVETGHVPSRVEVGNVGVQKGFGYIGLKGTCAVKDFGPAMENAFSRIQARIDDGTLPKPDFMFSIYHRFDMVGQECEYTSGAGYFEKSAQTPPNGMVRGEIPGHRALEVVHTGPYRHLGNAWAAGMGCQRADKLKMNKKVPMYEVYGNMPGETDEEALRTSIFIPVK